MAITYVAAGTPSSNGGGQNPTPGIPAGMVSGDVMLCVLYSREAVDGSATISTGWTQAYNVRTTGGLLAVWWRAWQSGDAAPTITLADHTGGVNGDSVCTAILGFRGANASAPIAQLGTAYSSNSTTNIGAIPGISMAARAGGAVVVIGGKNTSESYSVLTGDSLTWVEAVDTNTTQGLDSSLVVNYAQALTPSVTVTDKTFTAATTSAIARGIMLELTPAALARPYPIDAQGWSILPELPAGARNVYVATVAQGGDDGNDGLSEGAPKATISAGWALIRSGVGDRLWLRRGGEWSASTISLVNGASPQAPTVIGAWGTGDRPILDTGTSAAFATSFGNSRSYIVISQIESKHTGFTGASTNPQFVNIIGIDNHILIEGCYTEECGEGYTVSRASGITNIALRRNTVYRSHHHNGSGTADGGHGIFCNGVTGLWLEENVALHCGWKPTVVDRNDFAHGIYVQSTNYDVAAYRNIGVDNSAVGMHFRCEGTCQDNFFSGNRSGLQLGGGSSPISGGVVVDGRWNVIQEAGTGSAVAGLQCYNLRDSVVQHNLVCTRTVGTGQVGAIFNGDQQGAVFTDNTVEDNVVHLWGGPVRIQGSAVQLAGTTFRRNQVESSDTANNLLVYSSLAGAQAVTHGNNRLLRNGGSASHFTGTNFVPNPCTFAQYVDQIGDTTSTNAAHSYPDSTRTLIRYTDEVLELGDPTAAGLTTELRAQQPNAWSTPLGANAINNWMRAGFGMSNPPSTSTARRSFQSRAAIASVASRVANRSLAR